MMLPALSRLIHRSSLHGVRGLGSCLNSTVAPSTTIHQNYSIQSASHPPSTPALKWRGLERGCVGGVSLSTSAAIRDVGSTSAPVAGADYVRHWSAERLMSVVLLATVPMAFVCPWQPLEYLATLTVVVHSHWGVEAIVHDYIRPKIFGSVIPKLSIAAVWFLSAFMLGGLFYFNYTDVGLVEAVKMTWRRV